MSSNDTNNASDGGDGIAGHRQRTSSDTNTTNNLSLSNVDATGAGAVGQSDASDDGRGASSGGDAAGAAGGGNASDDIADDIADNDNDNSSGNSCADAAGRGIADDARGDEPPLRRTRARDPFLFYSDPGNLERARHFQPADYSTEDALRGTTVRKTRISYEKDVTSLLMNEHFQAEDQGRGIQGQGQSIQGQGQD